MSHVPIRKVWPVVLAALVLAVVAVVWAVSRSDMGEDETFAGVTAEPGMSHVHALGLDPGDQSLVAATHFGAFRIADGSVRRIGSGFQDTMGFSITDEGVYLGSGHPDAEGLASGSPPMLGLVRSDDRGETWSSVAMSGEADFHAIATSGDVVYAWDSSSGRVFRSDAEGDLVERSTLSLTSMAADPEDPDALVAATIDGVVRSEDGGQSWAADSSADMVTVSWDRSGGLWGATESGEVWQRGEEGWRLRGAAPGSVHVLLVEGDGLHAAGAIEGEPAIWSSPDGGESWEQVAPT